MSSLNIVNDSGREFSVRFIDIGCYYGLSNALVNDSKPLVEFWDMTDSIYGRFVSSYYVDTILEDDEDVSGLNLNSGVPEWYIDVSGMLEVVNFLKGK